MNSQIDPPKVQKSNYTVVWLVAAYLYAYLICLGLVCAASPFLLIGTLPTVFPTPTIDPGCKDYECLRVCLSQLPDIRGESVPGPPEPGWDYNLASYLVEGDAITATSLPSVPDQLKPYQEDTGLHQRIWNFFVSIIPPAGRESLTHFTLYTDGLNGKSAAQANYFPPHHFLKVDIFDLGGPEALTYVLVHETGHLITINPDQVVVQRTYASDRETYQAALKECGHFFWVAWCALPDSYINLFYERFWKGRHDETLYQLFYETYTPEKYEQIGKQLFSDYPDEFLTEYAAKNVSEDIAESFEHFVLWPKPTGDHIADQKALFFYEFPELVELREQIIQGICGYAARQ